jgi:hypothetical protein
MFYASYRWTKSNWKKSTLSKINSTNQKYHNLKKINLCFVFFFFFEFGLAKTISWGGDIIKYVKH